MSDKIRVGVVGVGYLGRFHAKIYGRLPAAELVGVVDADEARARTVAEECGCAVFRRPEDLIGKIDAVSIVVPTSLHLEVARPFLERGIHMLLEKPIAPTLEEAQQVVDLAERNGAVLQVGHLERYNAGVMALAARIRNPRFIEAHRMGEFVARATDVDVVTDLMIHDIDIILALVNSPIRSVSAIGLPVITQKADIANARLEFENGAVANVTASRVSAGRLRRLRIFEPNNYEALNFIDQQIDSVRTLPPGPEEQWPEIVRERVQIQPCQPLDAELEDFLRAVQARSRPLVDGPTGLQALKVALMVREKIEQ